MTAIVIEGYGPLTVTAHPDVDSPDRADKGLVSVRLPSLRRCEDGEHIWRLDLFPDEAVQLIAALATAVPEATCWVDQR